MIRAALYGTAAGLAVAAFTLASVLVLVLVHAPGLSVRTHDGWSIPAPIAKYDSSPHVS